MRVGRFVLALALVAVLAACGDESEVAEAPVPQEPTSEAVGRYCGMNVIDHEGPKGQIYVAGEAEPFWFTSVRDTLAFTRLPEEPKAIAAIYVNDMAKAKNWAEPEAGAWVEAREAHYVIGSNARGGMGAPEAVPFSDLAAAERFVEQNGGRIFTFDEVPREFVLGEAWAPQSTDLSDESAGHGDHAAPDSHGPDSHGSASDGDTSHAKH